MRPPSGRESPSVIGRSEELRIEIPVGGPDLLFDLAAVAPDVQNRRSLGEDEHELDEAIERLDAPVGDQWPVLFAESAMLIRPETRSRSTGSPTGRAATNASQTVGKRSFS